MTQQGAPTGLGRPESAFVSVRDVQQAGTVCTVGIVVREYTVWVAFDRNRAPLDARDCAVRIEPAISSVARRRAVLKRAAGAANDERHDCFRRRDPERMLIMAYAYGCLAAVSHELAKG